MKHHRYLGAQLVESNSGCQPIPTRFDTCSVIYLDFGIYLECIPHCRGLNLYKAVEYVELVLSEGRHFRSTTRCCLWTQVVMKQLRQPYELLIGRTDEEEEDDS